MHTVRFLCLLDFLPAITRPSGGTASANYPEDRDCACLFRWTNRTLSGATPDPWHLTMTASTGGRVNEVICLAGCAFFPPIGLQGKMS